MSIFKKKGSKNSADTSAAMPSTQPAPIPRDVKVATEPPNGMSTDQQPDKPQIRTLRSQLQKQLGREVSVQGEGPVRKVVRVATNPYLVLGAATVGVGVAGVLTAGTAHVVVAAIGTGQLSSSGSKAIEWWKSKKRGTVYLDPGAVKYLLSMNSSTLQVEVVEAVLSASPDVGDVSITAHQLIEAQAKLIEAQAKSASDRRPSRVACVLRSPYGRAGLALLCAGLFLIAVTVIPEYVRDPSLRVAVAVSAIGGILIATAVVDAFKDALTGPSEP